MIQLGAAIAIAVSAVQAAPAPRPSADEQAAILPALQAAQRQDWAAASAALPAARAAAQSPGALYLVGQIQLAIGQGTGDLPLQVQAMEAMLASGAAPPDQIGPLLNNIVVLAQRSGDLARAEQGLVRIVAREPGNLDRLIQLADLRNRLGRRDEALAAYRDAEPILARQVEADLGNFEQVRRLAALRVAIGLRADALALYRSALAHAEAAGRAAPEQVYREALALAVQSGADADARDLGRRLLEAHPTPDNWRRAIIAARHAARADPGLSIDIRRFMRAAGLLAEASEYLEFADSLERGGYLGEASAVLEEGAARGALAGQEAGAAEIRRRIEPRIAEDRAALARLRAEALAGSGAQPARTTADALYGYGRFGEAAELYRAALGKTGADRDLLNLRLAAALALSGDRAGAEAALGEVHGTRSEVAGYWRLWLAQGAR